MSFSSPPTEEKEREFVVVLDAGHGGHDPGNRGNGYYEKNIALNIVLKVGAILEKVPNVKVIYTRKTDKFITLKGRADIANNAKADLFVSVHCNAHSSQAKGTETFVLGLSRNEDNLEVAKRENSVIYLEKDYETTYGGFDPNSPESYIGLILMQEEYLDQSIMLADFIQKNFTNDLKRVNRGVKQNIFLVLRETYMPSVLVETGFLTNNEEGKYLNGKSGQTDMAQAIADAVVNYKRSINLDSFEETLDAAPVKTEVTSENFTDEYKNIDFKVQIAATSKKLNEKDAIFKGLQPISIGKEGKLYKYYFGNTSSFLKVKKLEQQAQNMGFSSSFIVAFKNGKKVSVNEALKSKVN